MAAQEHLHDRSARILRVLWQRIGPPRTPIRGITLSQSSKRRPVVLELVVNLSTAPNATQVEENNQYLTCQGGDTQICLLKDG